MSTQYKLIFNGITAKKDNLPPSFRQVKFTCSLLLKRKNRQSGEEGKKNKRKGLRQPEPLCNATNQLTTY